MGKVFKRKLYDKMLNWKQTRDGSTALLVKGARRVGKSTIAEEFAKNEYKSYILVDFADAPTALWEAIDNISDRNHFFMQLQFIYGVRLYERKSVIIFDEVQKCPKVREAIKYLVKDRRYDYIETGSLLSIRKNTKDIVIPSEETRLTMYPMDYEEFRWALDDNVTIDMLRECFNSKRSLGDATMRKLLRDFRLYMLVGGMPQAVSTYLETNNLTEVDNKKREILDIYIDDFLKIDPSGKISKMFMGDTGLFVTLAFWDKDVTENIIYQKLLSDKLSADLGYVYENVVAQLLVATGNRLFYHTWRSKTSNHNYEVDFLLSRGSKLWPLEVKSSGYQTHKSLDEFCKKYSEHISNRYLIYTKDFKKDKETILLPVFMTMFL